MGQTLCFTKADDFGEPFRVCSVLSISPASFSGLESDSLKFKINNYDHIPPIVWHSTFSENF